MTIIMPLIKKIQSSISLKLFLAFFIIVFLSLLSLLVTINSLSKTSDAQYRLTQEALPLLRTSNAFSLSLFEYLALLEQITTNQNANATFSERLQAREDKIQTNLEALQEITPKELDVTPIIKPLEDIINSSSQLQSLIIIDRASIRSTTNQHVSNIRENITDIRKKIRRHQIIAASTTQEKPSFIAPIEDNLLRLDEIISQYTQAQFLDLDEVKYLESRYTIAIRNITQQLTQIKDSELREDIALATNQLFIQITDKEGFFECLVRLNENINSINSIIQKNKNSEQTVNLILGQLLEKVGERTNSQLNNFTHIINSNIQLVIGIMIIIVTLTVLIIHSYVIPKITRRLQRLTDDTNHIASGDYDRIIDISGNDEIAQMAKALDGFKYDLIAKNKSDKIVIDKQTRLRNIINNAVDGLITIDNQGIVESFNPACEKIFGYSAQEVIGNNINLLMPTLYKAEHDTYLNNYLSTGKKKIIGIGREVKGRRKNGEIFPMDLSISEIDIDGSIIFSGIVRDITTRKQTESDREKLIDKLVNSNNELERFAFVCSHDLQEPLRMIRSFSEKLQNYMGHEFEKDEKTKKYFHFITEGASRAQQLIADILSYSSIDNDMQALETVNCEELILAVKENMQLYLEEKQGNITFDPLPYIEGNKTQLFQLFQNLINNGMKYQSSDNTPLVHIQALDQGSYWQFSITDNGIGMEERHHKKIFDVFKRLHRKNQFAGTGVGLSICKKIVERHSGDIWVSSEKGKGSTFYFTITKNIRGEDNDS